MRLSKSVHWLRSRSVVGWASESHQFVAACQQRAQKRLKPNVVQLEDRQLLTVTTFDVTSTLDTLDGSGDPTMGTLRWAAEQADAATTPSTIEFDLGPGAATITLEQLLTPVELSNTSEPITIDGPGANLLTINGNNEGGVFQIDAGVTASITGLSITGASLGNNGAVNDLGALTISDCTLYSNTIRGVYVKGTATISDCTITGDNTAFSGAGVFVSGSATVTGCTIDNDSATTNGAGAGICNQGTTTVTNCTISGDNSLGGGGGLYNSVGTLTVTGCTVSGDSGSGAAVYNKSGTTYLSGTTISGGGGFIDGGDLNNQYGATMNVSDCTISGGVAEIGGGLYNAGQATLTDCTISGNDATGSAGGGQGGGISNGLLENKAVLILTDSTVEGNTAKLGGGGLFNNGTATVTDSTFVNNFANQAGSLLASDGGAVNNSGKVTLVACTISGNTTTKAGGGIYNGGLGVNVATLNDTIIAGNSNTSGDASDIANSGGDFTCSYDLLGLGVGGTISGGTGDIVLTSLNDLELAPLANYGGPTETMALLPGGPALTSGSQALELGPGGQPLTTDQRGLPLDTPTPDIGAFQSQGFTLTTVDGSTPQSTLAGTAFAQPLSVMVTANNSIEPVSGGVVTYTVNPASNGATASLSSPTATIGADGVAEVNATAGSIGGSYTVTGSSGSVATPVVFDLVNQLQPTFSGLSDQSITYGTASATFSGTLASGSQIPQNEDVAVTLGTVTQKATIGSGGAFSTTFNTAGLSASPPATLSVTLTQPTGSFFLPARPAC